MSDTRTMTHEPRLTAIVTRGSDLWHVKIMRGPYHVKSFTTMTRWGAGVQAKRWIRRAQA